MTTAPWKISLHGGHSGEFCDHATGSLREVLDAAIANGFTTYGVSEHVPRMGEQYLYENEIELGWTVEKIVADFERYGETIFPIAEEYADRLTVLRGFEIEVVPHDRYIELMTNYRERFKFDFMVGSVHYINDISIDGPPSDFERAMESCGGFESLAIHYYERIAEMVRALKPEVVGHLDLIRKNGHRYGPLDTPAIRDAAQDTLETIREYDAILDLNTAGWRKGLDSPYPEPWLVQRCADLGIPFCFGDDSHSPDTVGAGIEDARQYLLNNGVREIVGLNRTGDVVSRHEIPLT